MITPYGCPTLMEGVEPIKELPGIPKLVIPGKMETTLFTILVKLAEISHLKLLETIGVTVTSSSNPLLVILPALTVLVPKPVDGGMPTWKIWLVLTVLK